MSHTIAGTIKCVIGDRYELLPRGDTLQVTLMPGRVISQSRYSSKGDRKRIITAWSEQIEDFTIIITPDETITDE